MFVAVYQVVIHTPHCHSLKEKRAVVRHLVDRTMSQHKVRVSEVGAHDMWQRIALGFAVVGGDATTVESVGQRVVRSLESDHDGRVLGVERDVVQFGGDPASLVNPEDDCWVPDFAVEES